MSDTDYHRINKGFLTEIELIQTTGEGNIVLDTSVLISKAVGIGTGNVFYPGVVIEQQDNGAITIGNDNIFYPGTYIVSSEGSIAIGNANEFGPAGAIIRANIPEVAIRIGDNGRYCDGANIMGNSTLGSGSQVLGNITVQNCTLESGSTYKDTNPDMRAAVLKGFGLARNITLATGQVVSGTGDFSQSPIELQSTYHPKPSTSPK